MKVLVACEFSGRVRDAFQEAGHHAWSCDLLGSETPGNHYRGDVRNILGWAWDLMICHPPCTYLAKSGARWHMDSHQERADALAFVRLLLDADIPHIALENPIGRISTAIRKPDQIIHPWEHGHGEVKPTCLWLKGLPKLVPSAVVEGREPKVHWAAPGPDRWKARSRTYPGIAQAMAQQWGSL